MTFLYRLTCSVLKDSLDFIEVWLYEVLIHSQWEEAERTATKGSVQTQYSTVSGFAAPTGWLVCAEFQHVSYCGSRTDQQLSSSARYIFKNQGSLVENFFPPVILWPWCFATFALIQVNIVKRTIETVADRSCVLRVTFLFVKGIWWLWKSDTNASAFKCVCA